MKTLILYASKYGTTAMIAEKIAKAIDNAVIVDLNQETSYNLNEYDSVIIGTAVYAGNIHKAVKQFFADKAAALKPQSYGIYLCGLEEKHNEEFFKRNFAADVRRNAKILQEVGGYFDPAKSSFFEKTLMKMITKSSAIQNTINEKALTEFINVMRSQ